ncbi:MAG: Pr6Pr family membrane protein [Anaerolineaceae bacterium]|nr:Pr6Pr family membrane protein [Anaerolineaceae bacterium]
MTHFPWKPFRILTALLVGSFTLWFFIAESNLIVWLRYYTKLSNIFVSLWFVLAALLPLIKGAEGAANRVLSPAVKGAVTTYIFITGIVYALFLVDFHRSIAGGTLPWTAIIQHYVVPGLMLFDYLFAPVEEDPPWKTLFSWMIFPLLYLVETLLIGWVWNLYPYPFIDPQNLPVPRLIRNYLLLVLFHFAVCACFLGWARIRFSVRKRTSKFD